MGLDLLHEWLMNLSSDYNVNPYIFASIYVGAIPFFMLSVAWLIRNKKEGKSIVLPVIATGFCLSSAYLYLFVAGENVPVWVYILVLALIAYGIYATYLKVRKRKEQTYEI